MTYDSRPENYEHIHQVQRLLTRAIVDLQVRLLMHDRSKVADADEVAMFDHYTPLLRVHEYGTPEYKQAAREVRSHCLRPENDHHPECFGDDGLLGMHFGQLVEMCCDWIAASRRNPNGDVLASVRMNAERFGYDEQVEALIRNTVRWLLELEDARALGDELEPGGLMATRRDSGIREVEPVKRSRSDTLQAMVVVAFPMICIGMGVGFAVIAAALALGWWGVFAVLAIAALAIGVTELVT